ncbi:MAG: hypothetical protein FWH21_06950 [Kiritimatiellaeota bacterium]|nr:hypothetical protein [Kiritimatiellota bacterium]
MITSAQYSSNTNGNPSVTLPQIETMVTNANHYGRQFAMAFTKGSVTYITDNAWFDLPNAAALFNMFSHTSNVGGLEVYCVNSFWDGDLGKSYRHNPPFIHQRDGIAVVANAPPHALIHEILHACGMEDISDIAPDGTELDNRLVNVVDAGSANWSGGTGTGYYPADLTHRTLVRRLLMYAAGNVNGADFPLGRVRGYGTSSSLNPTDFIPRLVSADFLLIRNPQH